MVVIKYIPPTKWQILLIVSEPTVISSNEDARRILRQNKTIDWISKKKGPTKDYGRFFLIIMTTTVFNYFICLCVDVATSPKLSILISKPRRTEQIPHEQNQRNQIHNTRNNPDSK